MRPVPISSALALVACLARNQVSAQTGADQFLEKAARFLAAKGYANDPRRFPEIVRIITSRVPTHVPGLGTDGPRLIMGIERKCTDSLNEIPKCVRIDMLEVFAGADTAQRGVIPLTFAGPRGGAILERLPSRDVLAEANIAARAVHTRVFRPEPLAALPQTPEQPRDPTKAPKRVPFLLGSHMWASKELVLLGFPLTHPALLDSLRRETGARLERRPEVYQHLGMARRSGICPEGYPKGCRRIDLLLVRLETDTVANRPIAKVTALSFLRMSPDSVVEVPAAAAGTEAAAAFLEHFATDPSAQPFTDE